MSRRCETIITPTTTSAAAATSVGTIDASGVTNIAAKNSTPVTRFAKPGARALLDARRRLEEHGVRRRRRRPADDRARTLDDQRRAQAREGAAFVGDVRPRATGR